MLKTVWSAIKGFFYLIFMGIMITMTLLCFITDEVENKGDGGNIKPRQI
jgi:hypothetical protein